MQKNILNNDDCYKKWRDNKIKQYESLNNCWLEIKDGFNLSKNEINRIKQLCATNNFALIKMAEKSNYYDEIVKTNNALGLVNNEKHYFLEDTHKLTRITPKEKRQGEFIPYTDKQLGWHTDGYYNKIENRIRSFTLFCENPALSGGANYWLDIEMLYITLREADANLSKLLTINNAMKVPAYLVNNKVQRSESIGAIFLIDNLSNTLYMRYTQRKTNIKFNPEIIDAINLLNKTLDNNSYNNKLLFNKGEGIISNNVIHKREAFINDTNTPRVMLRGRYFIRV